MRAIVYDQPRSWAVADVPMPTPGAGEVRVKVLMAGVCGTDRHLHEGEFGARFPLTPGHEIFGEVVALGSGVKTLVEGDHVVMDNSWSCGQCEECRRGMGHFCHVWESQGVNLPGGFAEYVVARESKCWKVNGLAPELAVLAEPTACVVHGLDKLAMRPGSSVAIFGAGPTGLILTQLMLAAGAFDVTVCAPSSFKLDLARERGATRTVTTRRGDPSATMRAIAEVAPSGFDVVIDATGAMEMLEIAIPLTRTGGTVLVYGMVSEDEVWSISPFEVFRREISIVGSVSQINCFDRAVVALRNGVVSGEGLVTHHFGLEEYGDALAASADSACIKAVIVPHGVSS